MELRKGYKNTEVGIIPEDWKIDIIENISLISTGSKNTQDKIEDGNYLFFVRSNKIERINSYSFDGEAVLTAGDGVGTGKVFHYVNSKFDYHQRVYKISNFRKNNINGYFFYLYFSNYFYFRIMQMTAKSSVDSIRLEMIAKMPIPIPPYSEQTAIASTLSDIDALISSLEKLIAKKRLIKQGTMQKLLQPKEGWEVQKLGDIVNIRKGNMITESLIVKGNIPVIAGGKIPAYYHNKSNRKGTTITISASGASAGYVSIHNYPIFASDCSTIEESTDYSVDFIYFYLKLIQEKIFKMQSGGAQPHIHPRDLIPINVPIPLKNIQHEIAKTLSDMDSEIKSLENKLNKYKMLKLGMMQNLLTGKIRLI